jgi:hypothetical protein
MKARHSSGVISSSRWLSSTRVVLWTSGRVGEHLRHEVLEPRRQHAVVRLIDARIGVQPVVDHDPVDEVVDDGGDV